MCPLKKTVEFSGLGCRRVRWGKQQVQVDEVREFYQPYSRIRQTTSQLRLRIGTSAYVWLGSIHPKFLVDKFFVVHFPLFSSRQPEKLSTCQSHPPLQMYSLPIPQSSPYPPTTPLHLFNFLDSVIHRDHLKSPHMSSIPTTSH